MAVQGVRVSAVRLSIRVNLMNDRVRERKGTRTGRIADSHYVMLCSTWHIPPPPPVLAQNSDLPAKYFCLLHKYIKYF